MVIKVRDRVGGEGVLIGEEAEGAREDIERHPGRYFVAQESSSSPPPDAVR